MPGVLYATATCDIPFVPDANGTRHSPCYQAFDGLSIAADTSIFQYDAVGNMLSANNGDARISRSWYPNGALKTDSITLRRYSDSLFTHTYGLTHRYDLAGRRVGLKHPAALAPTLGSGRDSVIYSYHAWGPLAQVTGLHGETYSYAYDLAGRMAQLTYPGSVRDTSRFDLEGRVTRRLVATVSDTLVDDTLTFAPSGQILGVTMGGSAAGGGGWATNWYDGAGGLIASTWQNASNAGSQVDEYRLDVHGNAMWAHKWNSGTLNDTLTYVYEGSGRVVTIAPVSTVSVTVKPWQYRDYDNSGNTSFATEAHRSQSNEVWNTTRNYYAADEKLRQVTRITTGATGTRSDVVDEYRYDALGRRIMVRSNHTGSCDVGVAECTSAIMRFVWDGDQLLYELRNANTSGSLETETGSRPYGGKIAYVHGAALDHPLGVLLNGDSLLVPHVNWRGHYIAGTDSSGARVGDPNLTWHGARIRVGLEGGALDGHWWGGLLKDQLDASTMLYRRNRYYDPGTGRFTQQDPIGLAGGMNLYGFAGGDPITYSDPFGLCPQWLTGRPCSGAVDVGAGFVPGLSTGIDLATVLSGENPLTGESVGMLGRGVALAGVLTPLSGGQIRGAARGLGNISGGSATVEQVLEGALNWLGEGYSEIRKGVFRSKDGSRQFRMKSGDLTDAKQGPHVHFESVGPDGRKIEENSHVRIRP